MGGGLEMYDPTIHTKTIARCLTEADFAADKQLFDVTYKKQKIEEAVAIGKMGFSNVQLKRSLLRGKYVYQLARFSDLLVARLLTSNIRRVTVVKQDNRQFIVTCIKTLMSNGGAFRVYKYDIKSFYETVSTDNMLDRLRSDVAFSGQSSKVISSLFKDLKSQGLHGLPRGLSISATLAEYIMRPFDNKVSSYDGVWYYARFVDDIIVVTKPDIKHDEFDKFVLECLPKGLIFNKKTKSYLFSDYKKSTPLSTEYTFDFLGYSFSISTSHWNNDNKLKKLIRDVDIDIAASKVRRIKTRIAKSLVQFKSDGNFNMLLDRFRLLTSNYSFVDWSTGQRNVSGIYYSYPLVDPKKSKSLQDLDRFVRSVVLHPHPKNKLRPGLKNKKRQLLLRMTFMSGFEKQRFFYFSTKKIAELKDCWKYA